MMVNPNNSTNRAAGGGGGGGGGTAAAANIVSPDEAPSSNGSSKKRERDDEENEATTDTHGQQDNDDGRNVVPPRHRRHRVAQPEEADEAAAATTTTVANDKDKILSLLTKDLASNDFQIVKGSLTELSNLCVISKVGQAKALANAKIFQEFGGQSILLHFINKNQNRVDLLEYAIPTLCNSIKPTTHPGSDLGLCIVESVVQTMKAYPESYWMQRNGTLCLGQLLSRDQDIQKIREVAEAMVLKHNTLAVLEEGSRRFPDNIDIQRNATALVWKLTVVTMLQDEIRDAGGLLILARGIKVLKGVDEFWYEKAKAAQNRIS